LKALVVDDEKLVADVISVFLKRKGMTVDLAYDLAEGMARSGGEYDLVILDISLNNEQSFPILEKIKKESPLTVVVMFSGYGTEEYLEKAKRLGADDFVPKPFRVEYLVEYLLPKIEALIAQRNEK
jgi:DNA-binding response OmpR family regulator